MPVANAENYCCDLSHMLYVSAFTAMKDSTIISSDYNSNSIPHDLEPQLHFTTLLSSGTTKKHRIIKLGDFHKTINTIYYTFPIGQYED